MKRKYTTIIRIIIFTISIILVNSNNSFSQSVGISNVSIIPDPSSALELRSNTLGFLLPRMTTTERDLIVAPADGLLIFNTTTNFFNFYKLGWQVIANVVPSTNLTGAVTSVGSVTSLGSFISANLSGALTDETGTGFAVFGTTPTLTTPVINGAITGTTVFPIVNGGTGSSIKNFIDLTTAQTAAGAKTWSSLATFNQGITSIGATVDLNTSSNFATSINAGTSTGAITLGGTGVQVINIGNGAAAKTVTLGSNNSTSSTTLFSGTTSGVLALNASAGAAITNIGTGTTTGLTTIGGATGSTVIGSLKNTIGIAGTANGNGVRIGNARVTVNKPLAPVITANANTVATVTQILDAGIFVNTPTVARTFTYPSAQGATGLVQALPGTPAVGDIFTFVVVNKGTSTLTFAAAADITIAGSLNVLTNTTRVITCRVTSITAGAETISAY